MRLRLIMGLSEIRRLCVELMARVQVAAHLVEATEIERVEVTGTTGAIHPTVEVIAHTVVHISAH